eukprot:GHVR01097963.1.p4 GENE.GHVR01097963.1~~GHVR01097963.1.p4  ORF type:complete len:104 (-),score=20.53 GHVR01097963.1:1691-2002(-)
MKTLLSTAWAFTKGVPREVWYVVAAAAFLLWFAGNRYDAGQESVYAKLRAAEATAAANAQLAAQSADAEQQEQASEFQAEQEALAKVIEKAEANDENPLDAIF